MKKIKGLLLFGILTLLGIGSSFGYLYDITEVSFKSDSNKYINFGFVPGNSNTYSNYYHYYSNTGSLQKLNILRKSTTLFPGFDLSSYSLTTFSSYSYTSKKYYLSDSCADVIVTGSSYGIISHIYGLSGCNSQENLSSVGIGSNGLFYVNGGDNCINSGVLNTNTCDYSFYKTFGSQTFDSRFGLYSDNQYSGSDYGKTSISFPFSDSYSFFGNIAWSSDGALPEVYNYSQKYLYYSGGDFNYIGGLYVARINDLNSYDGNSGFQVIALSLSGGFNDSDLTNNYFNYGIFDCPVSAQNLFDCTFNDGGTSSSLYTNSSITGNVLRFLSTSYSYNIPGNSNPQYLGRSIKNYYNRTSNYIYFYRFLSPYNASSSSGLPKLISTTFQLISDGNNYFQDLFPSGSQSTGSIAINTGFLDLCLNNLQFGELNSYLCNKLFNGNNLVLIPGQTGYYLSYGYDENGNLRFWITYQEDLEDQMSGYVREQDENGNWYTYLPEDSNTGVDNSNGLKDYFNNWFEHGVFFSCPFHYTDSYYREFKLFGITHFVPKLGQSFLYPIYCMGAGFREGKNIDFFSGVNLGLESQLLSSSDYNYLYRLFDLILSVLIMFFIIKIYHLLN